MTTTSSSGSPRRSRSPHPGIRPAALADGDELLAVALAGLAPFPVAAVVSALPVGAAGPALTLVAMAVVVAVAGWIGGWRAGLAAAVVAGLSADFFHAAPVHVLRLDADDLAALALLCAIGVLIGGGRPDRPAGGPT